MPGGTGAGAAHCLALTLGLALSSARIHAELIDLPPTSARPGAAQVLRPAEPAIAHASAVLSANGESFASASPEGAIRLWNAASGALQLTLVGHTTAVLDLAFSDDGRLLASASADGTARIWETRTGEMVTLIKGHEAPVASVDFSPDSTRVVTFSADGTVRLWNAADGRQVQIFKHLGTAMENSVLSRVNSMNPTGAASRPDQESTQPTTFRRATFSADGTRVITETWAGTLQFWPIPSEQLRHVLLSRNAAGANSFGTPPAASADGGEQHIDRAALTAAHAALVEEVGRLRLAADSDREQQAELTRRAAQLNDALQNANAQLEISRAAERDATTTLRARDTEHASLGELFKALAIRRDELTVTVDRLNTELGEARIQASRLGETSAKTLQERDQLAIVLQDTRISADNHRRDALQSRQELEETRATLNQTQADLHDARHHLDARTTEYQAATAQIGLLETAFENLRTERHQLSTELEQERVRAERLEADAEALKADAERLKTDLDRLKAHVEGVEATAARSQHQSTQSNATLTRITAELALTHARLQASEQTAARLGLQHSQADAELQRTRTEATLANEKLQQLEKQRDALAQRVQAVTDESRLMASQLEHADAGLKRSKADALRLEEALALLGAERAQLETQLRETMAQGDQHNEREASLRQALAAAQAQAESHRQEIAQGRQDQQNNMAALEKIQAELTEANARLVAQTQASDELAANLQSERDRSERLGAQLQQSQVQREALAQGDARLRHDLAQNLSSLAEAHAGLREATRQLRDKEVRERDLSAQLAALTVERNTLSADLARRAADAEAAQARIAGLEQAVAHSEALRAQLDELSARAGRYEAAAAEAGQALRLRETELARMQTEVDALVAQRRADDQTLELAHRQAAEHAANRRSLAERVEQLSAQRAELQTRLEELSAGAGRHETAAAEAEQALRLREAELARAQAEVATLGARLEAADQNLQLAHRQAAEQAASQRTLAERVAPTAAVGVPETPTATPAAPEPAPDSPVDDVLEALQRWSKAWASKDVKNYLAHYDEAFQPPRAKSRKAWTAERRRRLTEPDFIEIRVSGPEIRVMNPDTVQVTFQQTYRSDNFREVSIKRLEMVRRGNAWRIAREESR